MGAVCVCDKFGFVNWCTFVCFSGIKLLSGVIEHESMNVSVVLSAVHALALVLCASDAWLQSYWEKCARNWAFGRICLESAEGLW